MTGEREAVPSQLLRRTEGLCLAHPEILMSETMSYTSLLESQHLALSEELEQFCNQEIEPRSAEQPDYISQARDFLRRLAARGLLRYVVPQACGGIYPHLDIRSLCLIRRALARRSSLADTMFAMQGLGSYPITLAGSESIQQRYLPKVASGEFIATFALTEPQAGSDPPGPPTTPPPQPH